MAESLCIAPANAKRFIDGYQSLLESIHLHHGLPKQDRVVTRLAAARDFALTQPGGLAAELARSGLPLEAAVASAISGLRLERWVHVRATPRYSLVLDAQCSQGYAVKSLTTPLPELTGESSFAARFGLTAFEGQWLSDGLLSDLVVLGAGLRRELSDRLRELKALGQFSQKPQ